MITDTDKTALEIFAGDATTYGAVKKVALDHIESQKDIFIRTLATKKDISNERVGAQLRAFDEAVMLVGGIFREIGSYRKGTEVEIKNTAR